MKNPIVLRASAPAKINLGLEITGRRLDGYHEVVTVLQTIEVVDVFNWRASSRAFRYLPMESVSPTDDLVLRALCARGAEHWTGDLWVEKHIPLAAGLGGGSSDAALALRLADPDTDPGTLAQCAAQLGADVPFFLRGGTALATGIGTELTPLQTTDFWVVLIVPELVIPDKTRFLYSRLESHDFSDGSLVREVANRPASAIRQPFPNAFERQMRRYPEVARAWAALAQAASAPVSLSGAGPTIFACFASEQHARGAIRRLPPDIGAAYVARTLPANDAEHSVRTMAAALRGESPAL